MTSFKYLGKELADYSLWDLGEIKTSLDAAEAKRVKASEHPKFNVDREIGKRTIPKMEFPPPNPKFIELKNAIEAEIDSRNKKDDFKTG